LPPHTSASDRLRAAGARNDGRAPDRNRNWFSQFFVGKIRVGPAYVAGRPMTRNIRSRLITRVRGRVGNFFGFRITIGEAALFDHAICARSHLVGPCRRISGTTIDRRINTGDRVIARSFRRRTIERRRCYFCIGVL
jgi:hypothetical protein